MSQLDNPQYGPQPFPPPLPSQASPKKKKGVIRRLFKLAGWGIAIWIIISIVSAIIGAEDANSGLEITVVGNKFTGNYNQLNLKATDGPITVEKIVINSRNDCNPTDTPVGNGAFFIPPEFPIKLKEGDVRTITYTCAIVHASITTDKGTSDYKF